MFKDNPLDGGDNCQIAPPDGADSRRRKGGGDFSFKCIWRGWRGRGDKRGGRGGNLAEWPGHFPQGSRWLYPQSTQFLLLNSYVLTLLLNFVLSLELIILSVVSVASFFLFLQRRPFLGDYRNFRSDADKSDLPPGRSDIGEIRSHKDLSWYGFFIRKLSYFCGWYSQHPLSRLTIFRTSTSFE